MSRVHMSDPFEPRSNHRAGRARPGGVDAARVVRRRVAGRAAGRAGRGEAPAHAPGGGRPRRRIRLPARRLRADEAEDRRELDFAHFHTYDETVGLLQRLGREIPGHRRSVLRRPVVRGPRDLADHDRQQEDRQAHRSAGVLHRRRPARRGDQRHRGDALLHQPCPDAATAAIPRSRSSSTRRPSTPGR